MIVSFGHNNVSCDNLNEFEKVIREQLSLDSSEVWVSVNGGTDDAPCLGILINSIGVSINHFGDDGSCYVTCGEDGGDTVIPFCDGQYEVYSYQIISKADALKAILDFYQNKGRSDSVKWEQLY